jgi:hypothetical protein
LPLLLFFLPLTLPAADASSKDTVAAASAPPDAVSVSATGASSKAANAAAEGDDDS